MKNLFFISVFCLSYLCHAQIPGYKLFKGNATSPQICTSMQLGQYYYDNKTDLFVVKHTFGLKEIPKDELIRMFRNKDKEMVDNSNGTIRGAWNGLMVKSPLKSCGIKGTEGLKGSWNYMGVLKLESIVNTDGSQDEKTYKLLQKKFGYGDRLMPQRWTADVMMIRESRPYMGIQVSPEALFVHYENGVLRWEQNTFGQPDFFSYCSNTMLDGSWATAVKDGMFRLSSELNREVGRIFNDKEITISVLLMFDEKGEYNIVSLDNSLTNDQQTIMKQLKEYAGHLRLSLFKPLFTADGRIMSARYWKVVCGANGWSIEDYMTE